MALWIQISPGSNEPIYGQIVRQISQSVAQGRLNAGDKLPAVRRLAEELVINPNTVARAYSELEKLNLVTTKTGSGTFINDPALRGGDAAELNILVQRMDNVITQGLNLGLSKAEIVSTFKNRVKNFTTDKSENIK
jgi:GntR family transcriptional regulator